MPRTKRPKWQSLSWHAARDQWKKYRDGRTYYLGEAGVSRTRQTHDHALREWSEIAEQLDAAEAAGQQATLIRTRPVKPARNGRGHEMHRSLADRINSIASRLDRIDAGDAGGTATIDGRIITKPAPAPVTHEEVEALRRDLAAAGVADHPDATLPAAVDPKPIQAGTQTIRQVMDAHLETLRQKHAAGERGGKSLRSRSWKFESIRKWTPPGEKRTVGDLPAERLDGRLISTYHTHLLKQISDDVWSPTYAAGHLAALKTLIRWGFENEHIDALPRNINSRHLTISKPEPVVKTMAPDHIAALLKHAAPRTRAFVLLGLNCGMTAQDISDLKHDELDLDAGTITRRRSKSQRARTACPVVTWPLWKETAEAIRETMTEEGPLVFVGQQGRPMVVETIRKDGRVMKTDSVRQAFDRTRRKLEDSHPDIPSFKTLRATSANALRQNADFSDITDLFLGHAAASVMDRHYAEPRNAKLAEAVAWLGKELNITK
jgi:integrase